MSNHTISPPIDIDNVVTCIKNAVMRANSEEDVRVAVSMCIVRYILEPLGIKDIGRYEYTLVSGVRADALYGHVLIEYKAPGKLSTERDIQKAKEQVIGYIQQESRIKDEYSRYLGVIISDKIAFVRYDHRVDKWIMRGPYEIRKESIIKLIEALRGLRRKPLDVQHILNDFGPKSQLTIKMVNVLYKILTSLKDGSRAKLLFDDWLRLFRQATGYSPDKLEELPKLADEYKIQNANYDILIFSIHTFYALLLKLIAAEITYLYGGGKFYRSYIAELDDAYASKGLDGLSKALHDLESGWIFRKLLNIENFLEGDYYSWYLEMLNEDLANLIAELARSLADYEIATPQLEPEFARDLLKRLYQHLVPSDLRHKLGEFYTPDWLANYLLDEIGLSLDNLINIGKEDHLAPLQLRVLDPACGSGTFLVLYISKIRRYAEEHYIYDILLKYILDNVIGYDLNPLAVLTARTNYLLTIADLLAYSTGTIEIPVYLSDSIMVEKRFTLAGDMVNVYILRTSAGNFEIPVNIVENGLLVSILSEISRCLENKYNGNDFRRRIELMHKLDQSEINTLVRLYEHLLRLEEEGKNKVWVAIIRNAFAPILKGKFDYIVGNPPWVNWENLPEEYRDVSENIWKVYGLTKITGKTGLGKVKRDLSMLFLARCFDLYLKENGRLGFLMPFTIFKTQAGAGFRRFLAEKTKIEVIHDLVTLYPFEGATNRASAIIVKKVDSRDAYKNLSGVKHFVWVNPSNRPIPTDKPLDEVIKETKRFNLIMVPLESNKPESPWMQITSETIDVVRRLIGSSDYDAHAGVYVGLNQVYYIRIKDRRSDGKLIITNPPEPGQKKNVKEKSEVIIEPDLVYPLIRGRDIKKWYVGFENRYVILPSDPQGNVISLTDMRAKYPNIYSYFHCFFNDLINRGGEPYKSKLEPYRDKPLKIAEEIAPPFYWVFNVKPSLTPYKVVWKRIAGAITGKAISFVCAVTEPINGKPVIPDDGTILIATETQDEAYYVAGILNSIIVRTIIASYTYELRQETHIADVIKIPKFDPKNETHKKIADLSKRAHMFAKCIYAEEKPEYCIGINAETELKNVESELDKAVAQLFELSPDRIKEFEMLMSILSGEEQSTEEDAEAPEEPIVTIPNTLLLPNTQSYIDIEVVNPSGKEIEFYYELPWDKGYFRLTDGTYKLQIPPLNEGKYKGLLRYSWHGSEKIINIQIEVSKNVGPKRSRRM